MEVVSKINYLAVLVAGLVFFALGAVWYSKGVFGAVWMKLINRTEEQARKEFAAWKLVWAFVGSLLAAYTIARILSLIPNSTPFAGAMIGLLLGINISFVLASVSDTMEGRPFKLTLINSLYNLVGLLIMGLIIGAWH